MLSLQNVSNRRCGTTSASSSTKKPSILVLMRHLSTSAPSQNSFGHNLVRRSDCTAATAASFTAEFAQLLTKVPGNVATDLQAFATHAGRSKIDTNDVMLLARRNEGLESILKEELDNLGKQKKGKAKDQ